MNLKPIFRISAYVILFMLVAVNSPEFQKSNEHLSVIKDEKVLSMLKHLSTLRGKGNITNGDGRLLYDLIIENGYKRGLEIGTSNGYSGLWIGQALKQNNGELVTLEIDPIVADEAKENFTNAGLDQIIEVRTADALKEIPNVPGTFDFVLIDALQIDYHKYLNLIRDRVIVGGAITAHDVISRDEVLRDFLNNIQNDPKLETTIQDISPWGISVSIVKAK